MAEAKERNLAPMLPSDMQSVLKRCETLEKEVRSLKLNLSFMNRYVMMHTHVLHFYGPSLSRTKPSVQLVILFLKLCLCLQLQ